MGRPGSLASNPLPEFHASPAIPALCKPENLIIAHMLSHARKGPAGGTEAAALLASPAWRSFPRLHTDVYIVQGSYVEGTSCSTTSSLTVSCIEDFHCF